MDSLQGIQVEYKLDTFNVPRTGTTLCHPQNWLCRYDAQLSSRYLALISSLGLFNGDNAHSPQITRHTKLTVTPKFISSNGNMAFAKLRRTQSLARPTIRAAFPNCIISPFRLYTHNLSTRLTAQKANPIFHAANKNYSKNTFRLSASYFFILLLFLTT